jgi:hypothetical protein
MERRRLAGISTQGAVTRYVAEIGASASRLSNGSFEIAPISIPRGSEDSISAAWGRKGRQPATSFR